MNSMRVEHGHRLLVVVGPSGAGKDSVMQAWLASLLADARPHLARRVITRPAHAGSEAHEPMSDAEFLSLAAGQAFAFDWQAHGLRYGVRWCELAPLKSGRWVIVNGSREHLPTLLRSSPAARIIEISAAPAELERRLVGRGREDAATVSERLGRQPAPVVAHLKIDNSGNLDDAVRSLSAWWLRQER